MTCREKLAKEHPSTIDPAWCGGCRGCPHDYNYLTKPSYCQGGVSSDELCTKCWDREIPKTEEIKKPKPDIPWNKIQKLIGDAVAKRDRSVSLYFNPETGISVSIYPWPDADELYEMYKYGKITANDFREKMGLPRVELEGKSNKE